MSPPADRTASPDDVAGGHPAPGLAGAIPLVSVVIPAYNRAATIRAAIESVLRQTWQDFELVVVDDGSTDGTLAAAAAVADPRLRVVASPHNAGAAAARNRGVAEARGPWIAFQDSDDEWLPEKLEKQMARLAGRDDRVGCYCGLLTVGALHPRPGERTRLRYVPDPATETVEGDILAPLLEQNMVSTQTLVVRRDVFLEIGRFDETMGAIEDWDFGIRLAARGPIAFVDEPLVHQRFSPNSLTRGRARQLASQAWMVEKNMALYAARPRALARQYYILAGLCRRLGRYEEARGFLARAGRVRPADPRVWGMGLYVTALGLARGGGRPAGADPLPSGRSPGDPRSDGGKAG
jgi:glycosyltransferase involved in cell wall biosynthesis